MTILKSFLLRFAAAVLALLLLIVGYSGRHGSVLLLSGVLLLGFAGANFSARRGTVASLYPACLGFAFGTTLALLSGSVAGAAADAARWLGMAVAVVSAVLIAANVVASARRERS